MKTEKKIKRQARQALQGNMVPLIAALGLCVLVFLLIEYLSYIPVILCGLMDVDDEILFASDEMSLTAFLIVLAKYVAMILAMPLVNGFLKTAANAALKQDCDATDVFYYFKSARKYFKTVALDAILFLLYVLITSLLDVYRYISESIHADLFEGVQTFDAQTVILLVALCSSVVIYLFIYMIFLHFPLLAYAINDQKSVGYYAFSLIDFSCSNFVSVLKLFFSYIGWLALCFFVVPILYVAPYVATGSLISAKWLFELDRNRGIV